ncbi:response regulator [Pontibacter arcticus]|uniref:Response regulator n=1 Tax=Pontibacter arcticus TaxID=2080288 RepID=A0A364RF46_9BACT|nr:response regulator [Pontibacter arcticus]RAU82887.1 response regulator [Pontibacter arcticus]
MINKIVLVDDMEISNFITSSIAKTIDPSLSVYEFTDAEVALNEITDINPDVVLLDLNMPGMDGWEFLDEMSARNLNFKVFILTSSTSELDKRRSTAYAQVAGFLVKPMEEEVLTQLLQSA